MGSVKLILTSLCATILCGCGPSAQQLAEQQAQQQARREFREAVAAMKVCTQGATFNEFRDKRLALETCYTANQTLLTNDATEFEHLAELMKATEILWGVSQMLGPGESLAAKGSIKINA